MAGTVKAEFQRNVTIRGAVTTHRSPSPQSMLLYWGARATLRHLYWAWPFTELGIRGLAAVERGFARLPHPPGVHLRSHDLGGVPIVTTIPHTDSGEAFKHTEVLYLPGGAFMFCGPDTHRRVCANLAVRLGSPIHAVRYRKLPAVDLDAVVDDAYSAYRALSARLSDSHRIVVAGDSAGGFLAAKICELAARDGIKRPEAVVLYSPLFNLDGEVGEGPWACRDAYQPARTLGRAQTLWSQHSEKLRGARSMLTVDPAIFPPVLITLAVGELVEAGALALTESLYKAGRSVETHRWISGVHAFPVLSTLTPESRQAGDITVQFLRKIWDK